MRWYPFYIEDYERDTRHLTPAEDGVYRRLIDFYMREGEAPPDNDRALAGIVRVGLDEWLALAGNVRPFFKAQDGFLIHKRCDQELRAQRLKSQKQSEKAKKAAFARYSKINGFHATSMPQACLLPATSYKESKTTTEQGAEVAGKKGASEGKSGKQFGASSELADLIQRKGWP